MVAFLSALGLGHANSASLAFLQGSSGGAANACARIYDFLPGMREGSFLCTMDMTAIVCFIEGSGQLTAVLHSMAIWRLADKH